MKKIIETDNCSTCHKWITNKINAGLIDPNDFKAIHFSDDEALNDWCMNNLSKSDIAKLRATIRQARAVKKNITQQITISNECHRALKALSKKHDVSFSELILSKIQAEFDAIDLKQDAEPEQAPEIVAAPIEQAPPPAPATSPTIATDDTILPVSLAEYNQLVARLKHTPEWQTKNGQEQNMARIFKDHGVLLPNGKMSKTNLTAYMKQLP